MTTIIVGLLNHLQIQMQPSILHWKLVCVDNLIYSTILCFGCMTGDVDCSKGVPDHEQRPAIIPAVSAGEFALTIAISFVKPIAIIAMQETSYCSLTR